MRHADYVPLHLHTEYSLLDGAIRIDELVEAAASHKMPAVAVTDHGNLFGAVEFYKKATKAGIKPIIGCEVYVSPGSRFERSRNADNVAAFHLVLLARDITGYKNLVTLVSRAYTEGFYVKPRIDKALLKEHCEGLIGLSACMQGEVAFYLRRNDRQRAREAAESYGRILGETNFFLEVQENGIAEQAAVNDAMFDLAKDTGLATVATTDCHYMKKSDSRAHEILLCIQTGKTVSDPNRMKFEGEGSYFRSPQEMMAAFKDHPEAVTNTKMIAERCNVEFELGKSKLPKFPTPDGARPSELLERMAREGLNKRFKGAPPSEYVERFNRELEVIRKMGYASYFLIVCDFIEHARSKGIPVGPGRGSAAGSLIAYSLGITDIDPIKYSLLFERFLNPERISMPDIDVDFCKDRRPEVIKYVSDKYGRDHVAQIITFGTMAARAAIRDVARALEFPYAEADRLAKLVPFGPKITIKDALKMEPALRQSYDQDPKVRELIDIAMRLEGLCRHASTHAAGVVISPEPLTDFTPLYKASGEEGGSAAQKSELTGDKDTNAAAPEQAVLTTQFDMGSVEAMGLIKFDFLGLKTLTVIEKAREILKSDGIDFNPSDIPLDDQKTFEFLGTGRTTGVFQLESDGMKDVLVKMQPSRFEDLIALVALYRPGPIKSGMITDFIRRKKGLKSTEYKIPAMADILGETYGVIVYQEQVMSIANRLAGFTMGQADVLRKAMGKKLTDVMTEQRGLFIQGAVKNKIPESEASALFDLIENFGEYGFNKSHSAAYALITYQTAYLKAHYPEHFMAATLSSEMEKSDKVVRSIRECRRMNIPILPPDVNLCGSEFTVDGKNIRFGLAAVKGVGAGAVDAVIEARSSSGPFKSLADFINRADNRKINKKVLEGLIKAGAFDSLLNAPQNDMRGLGRLRQEALDTVNKGGGGAPSLSLFGAEPERADANNAGHDEAEMLKNEKDALGFYISGSPLSRYSRLLQYMNVKGLAELIADEKSVEAGSDVNLDDIEMDDPGMNGEASGKGDAAFEKFDAKVAGVVAAIRKIRNKKGEPMAFVTIEDEEGSAEAIVFSDLYKRHVAILEKDVPVLVGGSVEKSEKGVKIVVNELDSLESVMNNGGRNLKAVISLNKNIGADLDRLRLLVDENTGAMPLYLSIQTNGAETLIQTAFEIRPEARFIDTVEELAGKGAFKVV